MYKFSQIAKLIKTNVFFKVFFKDFAEIIIYSLIIIYKFRDCYFSRAPTGFLSEFNQNIK